MNFKLSKPQRILVISLAAVIAVVLFLEIGEDGLDESPWLIGLLVIGGLLFVAFSSETVLNAPSNTMSAREPHIREGFLEIYTQLADFLKTETTNIVPLAMGEMRSELLKQADEVGLKLAFAVHWLSIARKSPEAQDGPEAKSLLHVAAGHLTETVANQLRLDGVREGVRARALKAAAKELVEYRVAAVESAMAFAANQNNPMDHLYRLVESQLPLGHKTPDTRENFYGTKVREQWRRLERR